MTTRSKSCTKGKKVDPKSAGVQARRTLASQNARHVQKVKSETRKKSGFAKRRPRKYRVLGRSMGQITRSIAKNKNRFSKLYQLFEGHFRDVSSHLPLKIVKKWCHEVIESLRRYDYLMDAFCAPRCSGSSQN